MVSIVATVAVSISAQLSTPDPAWAARILNSREASQILERRSHEPRYKPIPSVVVPARLGEDGAHLLLAQSPSAYLEMQNVITTTSDLIDRWRFQEADEFMSRQRLAHPEYGALVIDLAIKAEILARQWDRAYADSIVRVSELGTSAEEPYLYLSLASAKKGQVYPGQAQYCAAWIENYTKITGTNAPFNADLSSKSPRDIAVLSEMALGAKASVEFLEMALTEDPSNEFAAREAVLFDEGQGKFSDLRRIASGILEQKAHFSDGPFFVKMLRLYASKPDRTPRPIKP